MLTDKTNQKKHVDHQEDTSQSQNNNGNIARESGVENDEQSLFSTKGIIKDLKKPVNEEGIAENEENHWSGNHGQKSSNRPGSKDQDEFADQNLSNGVQQNKGSNHVTNAGGTSQEDFEKGKTGLKEEEES